MLVSLLAYITVVFIRVVMHRLIIFLEVRFFGVSSIAVLDLSFTLLFVNVFDVSCQAAFVLIYFDALITMMFIFIFMHHFVMVFQV